MSENLVTVTVAPGRTVVEPTGVKTVQVCTGERGPGGVPVMTDRTVAVDMVRRGPGETVRLTGAEAARLAGAGFVKLA